MRYAEGARLFFRFMAERLLVEGHLPSPVQLIAPSEASPPEEDQFLLAAALATRLRDDVVDAPVVNAAELRGGPLRQGPLVIDCRTTDHAQIAQNLRQHVTERPDVVVLVSSQIAQMGCRSVSFSIHHEPLFRAITESLKCLADQVRYSGDRIEMPIRYLRGGLRGVDATFQLFDKPANDTALADLHNFASYLCFNWVYAGEQVKPDTIVKWIKQFEPYDAVAEALSLLEYLDRDGFIPKGEIINRLKALYNDIAARERKRPKVVSIQNAGKSESMILYELRDYSKKSLRDQILEHDSPEHLICFDDVVGSGETIRDCLFRDKGTVVYEELERWLTAIPERRITVLCAIASQGGIDAVEGDPMGKGRVKVIAAKILGEKDKILSSASNIFRNNERQEKFQQICTEIGGKLWPKHPLGWQNCEWAVVTDYNAPNCSLPVIWSSAKQWWTPLFPRR
ncbi:hypothetical protein [Azospirillum sp. TSO5]|uniref:phosphoribosyltransferase-like protein n=1 Tax=Azospirillum sp. TSO5 TaxID=716760 RepID=UPI0011B1CDCF|nr:hypothetical protein [Azospirillum sp. TSO5]